MATVRLPGIYFETVAPPAPALLPRMDIAAFAGFVPAGPINLPFAVEDPARFSEIFGIDLPLAWDRERNEMRMAQTPPAVRNFFREGGRRCWVVRLAKGALANSFLIPGLLDVTTFGEMHAGWVRARSQGSWSDDLNVNATLLESALPAGSLDTTGSVPVVKNLNPGDVVQLYFPGTGTIAYHAASDSRWFWFREASAAEFGACGGASPPAALPDSVTYLAAGKDVSVSYSAFCSHGGAMSLQVSRDTGLSIPPGAWLKLHFGARVLLFQVETIEAGSGLSSSPPGGETASLESTLAWWVLTDTSTAWNQNRNLTVQVTTVTFELWAWPEGSPVERLSDLGLASDSPRFWRLLPTDEVLYQPVERPAPIPWAALAADIDHPRFPLALRDTPQPQGSFIIGLPLGMTTLVRDDFTQGADFPGGSALERDGLTSLGSGVSGEDLFIDPQLANSEASTLLQDAFFEQYQAQQPQPPKGLYSLLGIEEASLVAVPDATHTGWRLAQSAQSALSAPTPLTISAPDSAGNYTVSWGASPGAAGYQLQESQDPLFATGVVSRDADAKLSLALNNTAQCPLRLYYRVSAYGTAGVSPWSVTAAVQLGTGLFWVCNQALPAAPNLQIFEEQNRIILEWISGSGSVDAYTLQTADDPQFASGFPLYTGTQPRFEYWKIPGGSSYFRVNAQQGGTSTAWSNTVSTTAIPVTPFEVIPDRDAGPPKRLQDIHVAMLRMASARADMVAIMGLPLPFQKDDAMAYRIQLAQRVANEDNTGRMLSYGALYHPWVVVGDNSKPLPFSLRTLSPEGSVCGLIAGKTISSGAWIAPANLPVISAIALDPLLGDDTALVFADYQINLIAQQPEGFLLTDQNTLIADIEFQPLNVRRLLILLRRLALREGVRYVFQNISPQFQRSVARQFEQWMQQMLARGAFAGLAAQDSYRVVTDATVNPPTSIDQGIFVVELRVAPSRPMRFLTVRLVQNGSTQTVEEG